MKLVQLFINFFFFTFLRMWQKCDENLDGDVEFYEFMARLVSATFISIVEFSKICVIYFIYRI